MTSRCLVRRINISARETSASTTSLLRLMPLGGSVTYGQGSTHGNGYRDKLRQLLISDGHHHVEMVGSRKAGSMENNNNEGWRGCRIDQIMTKARKSVPVLKPNVFTVNAGSNDCLQDFEVDRVGERMGGLLEYLWSAAPESTVVLSTLLVNADEATEGRVLRFNERLVELARTYTAEQRRIVLVDMHGDEGPRHGDLTDGTHPDDAGYETMARIWHRGIRHAILKGFL